MSSRRRRRSRRIRSLFTTILYLVLLALAFRSLGIVSLRVATAAMSPAIDVGDRLLVVPIRDIERNDIVAITSPSAARRRRRNITIRRVVALPGELVLVDRDEIRVVTAEGETIRYRNESIQDERSFPGLRQVRLSDDAYFVIAGTGRFLDSREWGNLERTEIVGRAALRYWPANRTAVLRRE